MANLNLKTDSPISRRIALSFLDFLNSVEPASGVDLESLEVVKDCLTETFKLNSSSVDDHIKPASLVDIFSSLEASEQQKIQSDVSRGEVSGSSSEHNAAAASPSEAAKSTGDDWTREPPTSGMRRDELFGQFFAALEKINFFNSTADGFDDPVQLDKASHLFHSAVTEMERSGCQIYNRSNLADSLKSEGNKAMQCKLYSDAIERYTCAIALCENNAVYYCNRAAAFTQIQDNNAAIKDCLKSIEIDPSYSKAYSRLGLAYYAQGNYRDAIHKGFKKALQLDPNNESVIENIRVAESKLIEEEMQRLTRDENSGSTSRNNQDSDNQSTDSSRPRATASPFTSMPFDTTALPADIASMFANMAANVFPGGHSQERTPDSSNDRPNEPEIRMEGGNISFNFGVGEQMPEDLTGALRSVMGMFSQAAPQGNPQDNSSRRSTPPN